VKRIRCAAGQLAKNLSDQAKTFAWYQHLLHQYLHSKHAVKRRQKQIVPLEHANGSYQVSPFAKLPLVPNQMRVQLLPGTTNYANTIALKQRLPLLLLLASASLSLD